MSTTDEIKHCFKDLRVLGKPEFRRLLRWRTKVRTDLKKGDADAETGEVEVQDAPRVKKTGPLTDEELLEEMAEIRAEKAHEARKDKKKARKAQADARTRLGMGMTNKSFGVEEDDELFGLGQFNGLEEMDGDWESKVRAEWERRQRIALLGDSEAALDEDGNVIELTYEDRGKLMVEGDEDLEAQLEDDYGRFIKLRRDKVRAGGASMDGAAVEQADRTLSGKRARKGETSAGLIAARDQNDAELLSKTKRQREKEASLQTDMDAYVAMLNDKGGSAAGLKKKGKGKSQGVMREGYEKEADSSDDDSDDGKTGVGFQEGFDESSDEEEDDSDASSADLDDAEGEHIDQVPTTKYPL